MLATIGKLYKDYRPLPFFGLIAAILSLLGLGLFVSVFAEFTLTGLVPRFPTLIVSGFIMMGALLSLMCGLILDTSGKNARKNFELQLNLLELTKKE